MLNLLSRQLAAMPRQTVVRFLNDWRRGDVAGPWWVMENGKRVDLPGEPPPRANCIEVTYTHDWRPAGPPPVYEPDMSVTEIEDNELDQAIAEEEGEEIELVEEDDDDTEDDEELQEIDEVTTAEPPAVKPATGWLAVEPTEADLHEFFTTIDGAWAADKRRAWDEMVRDHIRPAGDPSPIDAAVHEFETRAEAEEYVREFVDTKRRIEGDR